MSNLKLQVSTQGVNGGKFKHGNTGLAVIKVFQDGNTAIEITVDIYEGSGRAYNLRDEPLIEIYKPNPTGKKYFNGTPGELINLLNNKEMTPESITINKIELASELAERATEKEMIAQGIIHDEEEMYNGESLTPEAREVFDRWLSYYEEYIDAAQVKE